MTNKPLVAIIVIAYNNLGDTLECLHSLTNLRYPDCCVLLVDNASTDGTPEKVKDRYPEIAVLSNATNRGYAGGCNDGLQYAIDELEAEYCLVLNNDTVIQNPSFLDHLVDVAQHAPSVGIVAPVVRDYSPPHCVQNAGIRLSLSEGRAKPITQLSDRPILTDAIHGCAFLVKAEAHQKIGGFDERFYLYWEEVDYCIRVRKAGYQLLVTPNAQILHKSGGTIGGRSEHYTYYFFRNRLLLMQEHAVAAQRLFLVPLLPLYALIHLFKSSREGGSFVVVGKSLWQAWRDYREKRFGQRSQDQAFS